MKQLLIIGARGFGRSVYELALSMKGYGKDFVIKGFLDDDTSVMNGYDGYPPIVSSVEDYHVEKNDLFTCAIGDVFAKKKYVDIIKEKDGVFMSIIHPTAMIRHNAKIGEGCIIGANSVIDCDVCLGNFVTIQFNVVIGHDSIIDDWSMIDCFSFTGGFTCIGKSVTLHTGSIVVPKIRIGDESTVNAGSVVIRNVNNSKTVMGNPAKELLIPRINR